MQSAGIGLYLHIPFCRAKCAYCDFPSFAGRARDHRPVVDAMCAEMERAAGLSIATVYVGGGTPTLLPADWLEELLAVARRHFVIAKDAEITVEANPGTVDAAALATLRRAGVNRLSFGAQSADAALLETLGRIHDWPMVEAAVRAARTAGFENLNLDLMYGIPGQSPAMFRATLEKALALSPEHLSCYSLIVEEDTPFFARYGDAPHLLPSEDAVAEMADDALGMCRDAGLFRYEISNYAKPGRASRHNLDCWHRREYLGIGVGAHSLLGDFRRANAREIERYLAGERDAACRIPEKEALFERVMLGLRLVDGILWDGAGLWGTYGEKFRALRAKGLLDFDDHGVWPTARGLDLQNRVLTELMD